MNAFLKKASLILQKMVQSFVTLSDIRYSLLGKGVVAPSKDSIVQITRPWVWEYLAHLCNKVWEYLESVRVPVNWPQIKVHYGICTNGLSNLKYTLLLYMYTNKYCHIYQHNNYYNPGLKILYFLSFISSTWFCSNLCFSTVTQFTVERFSRNCQEEENTITFRLKCIVIA